MLVLVWRENGRDGMCSRLVAPQVTSVFSVSSGLHGLPVKLAAHQGRPLVVSLLYCTAVQYRKVQGKIPRWKHLMPGMGAFGTASCRTESMDRVPGGTSCDLLSNTSDT
jgi:hypothetical protein